MKLYSNEVVFRGHPDKVCDQISAALLAEYLEGDPKSRCGIEVAGGKGKIFITGEVTSKAKVNVKKVTRRVLSDIGYNPKKYKIINNLGIQSSDIAMGVDVGGAGDQGMMFGYACNETSSYLPKAMVILQELSCRYNQLVQIDKNKSPKDRIFYPDGKAQITGVYDDKFRLVKIKDFVISYQNSEKCRKFSDKVIREMAIQICKEYGITEIERFLINPTGRFEIGGFEGDAGLTGRKIVVDAYQSFANVGGGCMNGKDPSKVDFSAAHKARELAVRFLKQNKLRWCEVQLSYAIGKAEPLAIYVDSNIGNIHVPSFVYKECEPRNIIHDLNLKHAPFELYAAYGHFVNFPVLCEEKSKIVPIDIEKDN